MYERKKLDNGFEYIELKNSFVSAKIALQGAHLFEFRRSNEEDLLWLSDISSFEYGVAIRGGVPICWPAFGMNNPTLAQHGFARTSLFELVSVNENDTSTEVILSLCSSDETQKLWNYKFELEVKFIFSETLNIELKTKNIDTKEFVITQALHTYFSISEISDAVVKGLINRPRFDALREKTFLQKTDITFEEEFDSVFQKVDEKILLEDKNRVISITNEGSSSVVVWNPWIEKGSKMSGMRADAYKEFVCIESANAYEDFRTLKPNEEHILKVNIIIDYK